MSLGPVSLVNESSSAKYVGQIVNIPITEEPNRTESVQLISLMNSFRAELSYQWMLMLLRKTNYDFEVSKEKKMLLWNNDHIVW